MSRDTQSYIDLLGCDTARVVKTHSGKLFLIIGYNKSTKDSPYQWYENNKPIDFEYVEEKTVASGYTDKELLASAKFYKKLSEMTMEEYFKYLGIQTL